MGHLHRTQIYIDDHQFRRLQWESRQEKVRGVSALIRLAIDAFLASRSHAADWGKDPLTKAVGKITLSVRDAAAKHDRYLYE
jgi:hypothetical protein